MAFDTLREIRSHIRNMLGEESFNTIPPAVVDKQINEILKMVTVVKREKITFWAGTTTVDDQLYRLPDKMAVLTGVEYGSDGCRLDPIHWQDVLELTIDPGIIDWVPNSLSAAEALVEFVNDNHNLRSIRSDIRGMLGGVSEDVIPNAILEDIIDEIYKLICKQQNCIETAFAANTVADQKLYRLPQEVQKLIRVDYDDLKLEVIQGRKVESHGTGDSSVSWTEDK